MNVEEILRGLETVQGSYGVMVRSPDMATALTYNETLVFPLASAAKVALGALVASLVGDGQLSWSLPLKGISLDPKESSDVLYPHLQGMSQLPLHYVVEIMIACHDHHCANAIANEMGGWDRVAALAQSQFPGLKISADPRDEENNAAALQAALDVIQYIVNGYRADPQVFDPVVAGMVRMDDKTAGIPPHHQWNMTGGLPHALIDIGVIGDPMSESYLMYAIAARNVTSRYDSRESDEFVSNVLRRLYEARNRG